ncbi:MAG: hypothetical protein J2P28_04090 [Actinobacteria bacterium]|nr:hypothetical protein [Actinomycetota bacterium]MBO0834689.1 hypothetical protein [Actinomycetota bacterium]
MQANELGEPRSDDSGAATVPAGASAGQPDGQVGLARRDQASLALRATLTLGARHPALQGLLALAVYLAVFIVTYAGPLLRHPGVPLVYQRNPDPNFYIWSLRWWPYAISHGLNPLHSSQIGAPAGYDLAWTTPTAAVAVLLAPVTEWFGPVASFNLTLVLAAPVSGWAAFVAARRLTGRFWAALAAGPVYGFAWYETGETSVGHPNLITIMLLPLMVYLVLLWRDGTLRPVPFVALQAVAMTAEFYVFNETFVWMTVLGAVLLLIGFLIASPVERSEVARLARLLGVAWLVALAFISPTLVYMLRHSPGTFTKALPRNSLDLIDLVTPWSSIALLVITLALAIIAWRSRLTRLLVISFILVVAVAAGPDLVIDRHVLGPLPWAGLWYQAFTRSAQPVRIIIFANLLLAVIVAVWLAMPGRSRLLLALRWILALAAVAGLVALLPGLTRNYAGGNRAGTVRPRQTVPTFFTSGEYRDYLRPGETVVVVSDRANAGMLFQAYTNFYFRLAGGFVNSSLNDPTGQPAPVAALHHPAPGDDRRFLAYARRTGVGAVIVEREWAMPWMSVFPRMGLHGTRVGDVIIYRT